MIGGGDDDGNDDGVDIEYVSICVLFKTNPGQILAVSDLATDRFA